MVLIIIEISSWQLFENNIVIQYQMNFLKKMLGLGGDNFHKQAQSTKIEGTLYRVIKDTRNIIYPNCTISFEFSSQESNILFSSSENTNVSSYAFPIHQQMTLVTFSMNKGDKTYACFQWCLDDSGDHVGCYMDPKDKDNFKDIVSRGLSLILNDENIKDHLKLCKQLPGIPVYKAKDCQSKSSGVSSKISSKSQSQVQINKILIAQASKPQNRMVHSASYFEIVEKQRNLIKPNIVFALKEVGKFQFEMQLINAAGYTFFRKELTPGLIYEINTDLGYIKWIHVGEGFKVVEINFDAKRDAAMSLKFAIIQCFYEFNTKKKLTDAIAEDQITYLNRIDDKPQIGLHQKIVKTYEDTKEDLELVQPKFVYGNSQAEKGLQKYRTFCQAKINNYDIASLGSTLETLRISQDNKVSRLSKKKLVDTLGEEIHVDNIVLHDSDVKAVLNDLNGQLHYYDLEKESVVQTYDLSRKGIQDIVPEYKLADTKDYKTLKAVSPNTVYEIDPRTKEGSVNLKSYQTNPEFNRITADCKGRFAISSSNGQIRLFDTVGKNANCKYPGFGEPVLHLDTTKDGKWLLATFKTYLLLLPTETEDQVSLYENKVAIANRPRPIKLKIKMEHLGLCKVEDLRMVGAKFDERKGEKEMFIVSGFGEYVVIWNLGQVIRGELDNYKFTRIDGELVQTDFMFNNVRKLIMATTTGIVIKENKVKS